MALIQIIRNNEMKVISTSRCTPKSRKESHGDGQRSPENKQWCVELNTSSLLNDLCSLHVILPSYKGFPARSIS